MSKPPGFMNKEQWNEIYDKARMEGYSLPAYVIRVVDDSLIKDGIRQSHVAICNKLYRMSEQELYTLAMAGPSNLP